MISLLLLSLLSPDGLSRAEFSARIQEGRICASVLVLGAEQVGTDDCAIPIAGASLEAFNERGERVATTTDEEGFYRLPELRFFGTEQDRVEITADGFATLVYESLIDVEESMGRSPGVTIRMTPMLVRPFASYPSLCSGDLSDPRIARAEPVSFAQLMSGKTAYGECADAGSVEVELTRDGHGRLSVERVRNWRCWYGGHAPAPKYLAAWQTVELEPLGDVGPKRRNYRATDRYGVDWKVRVRERRGKVVLRIVTSERDWHCRSVLRRESAESVDVATGPN